MTPHLNLPAPSTRRPAYSVFLTWRRPAFLINSHMGRFSAASSASGCTPSTKKAPLIPKLRGNFAEFLHESSHERLRILSLPACVGFWYGRPGTDHEDFLEDHSGHFANISGLVLPLGMSRWICLPLPLGPHRAFLIARRPS